MRVYTAYSHLTKNETVLLSERIPVGALVFPPVWLIAKRLWLPLGIMLLFYSLIAVLASKGLTDQTTAMSCVLAIAVFTALEGRNWQRAKLNRVGWKEEGVVIGRNLMDAEVRWFSRHQNPPAGQMA